MVDNPVAVPPILVPFPMLILNTPEPSVVAWCSSIKTFVPVKEDCKIIDCKYIFLSFAGFEKLSLAIAWKNIPLLDWAIIFSEKMLNTITNKVILIFAITIWFIFYYYNI